MTCIAALKCKNGEIIMGADSCVTVDTEVHTACRSKIVRFDGCLIGVSGSPRVADFVAHGIKPPSLGKADPHGELFQYVNRLHTQLGEFGISLYGDKEESEEETYASWFLVAFQGRLFNIDPSLSIGEYDKDWGAIGCGRYYANASLFTTEGMEFHDHCRLELALQTAAQFSPEVLPPFKYETLKAPGIGHKPV